MATLLPRPPRILIVNYHRDTNRAVERLLWMSGIDAVSAHSLTEARETLTRFTFEMLFCRITAVDGWGDSFIEETWNKHSIPSIAVVGGEESRSRAKSISPSALRGIVQMPADGRMLMKMMRAHFENQTPDSEVQLADIVSPIATCGECGGTGEITLLVSRRTCVLCGGTGHLDIPILDRPLRAVNSMAAFARFELHKLGIHTLRQAISCDHLPLTDGARKQLDQALLQHTPLKSAPESSMSTAQVHAPANRP